MQCLMAPTRSEINESHAKQEWMDVGIPSIRNFWRIRWKRRVLWLLFLISSLPLHLLYRSSAPILLRIKLTSSQFQLYNIRINFGKRVLGFQNKQKVSGYR
ncbi:hypothetical protein CCHR01_11121 [Colletotrichum chrysophilum]|uniref:DUF6536 domain-containing protein n=1 Tax=Colletotrichum chrysophilum TaxID=1836956 RepID=A0AAD9EG41_9PEZI|nr:hypothetical protein CCHR01_11121 [Colletotrichum chrysophilum]